MTTNSQPALQRSIFRTGRFLDFAGEKALVAQTRHLRGAWPLAILKEPVDNALDACEAGVVPVVTLTADSGITVADTVPDCRWRRWTVELVQPAGCGDDE